MKYKPLSFILLTLLIFACQPNSKRPPTAISQGELLYNRYCKACHGKNGDAYLNGAYNLTKSRQNQLEIIDVIANGRNNMIGYKKVLSEEEIVSIANYVLKFQ